MVYPAVRSQHCGSRIGGVRTTKYGEYLAPPEALADVPVNEIAKFFRLNGQAMRLGETVYEKSCAKCHGADFKGLPDQHTPDLTDGSGAFPATTSSPWAGPSTRRTWSGPFAMVFAQDT